MKYIRFNYLYATNNVVSEIGILFDIRDRVDMKTPYRSGQEEKSMLVKLHRKQAAFFDIDRITDLEYIDEMTYKLLAS
jgi:hypothetical protein